MTSQVVLGMCFFFFLLTILTIYSMRVPSAASLFLSNSRIDLGIISFQMFHSISVSREWQLLGNSVIIHANLHCNVQLPMVTLSSGSLVGCTEIGHRYLWQLPSCLLSKKIEKYLLPLLIGCLPIQMCQERRFWMDSREYLRLDLVCSGGVGSVRPDPDSSKNVNEVCQCAPPRTNYKPWWKSYVHRVQGR